MKNLSIFRNLLTISIILLSVIYAKNINAKEVYTSENYAILSDSIPPDSTGMGNLNSYEFSKKFGRGWNLGNTLEAIGGETAWGNPKATQQLIDSVKAAGFNTIRIPVAWSKFSDEATYTIDSVWMARVEEVINYALKDSMYVIMNEHWDGGWLQPTYAEQEVANERLAAMWKQIAVHFRDYGNHLIFAGTNEVMVDGDYGTPTEEYYTVQNGFNQLFVNTVRSTGGRNIYRYLAVQGFNTNIDHTINFFTMPNDVVENRLIVEVHYYDPYNFTINANSSLYVWGDDAPESEKWANESWADNQFQKMKTNFIDNNYGVILGEYSAMARLNLGDSLNAVHAAYRHYWTKYITYSIVKHGLVPYYWDNGYTGNHASGLFNRSTGEQAYPDIIIAIIDTSNVKSPEVSVDLSITSQNSIKLYPNPVQESFSLQLADDYAGTVKIYDSYGQLVQVLNLNNGHNMVNVSDLSPGMYFMQLPSSSEIITQKLIKE
jgi:endoglucanase